MEIARVRTISGKYMQGIVNMSEIDALIQKCIL